jgi:hypothetical protein
VFYHSKLSQNEGDAVAVGADSVEQLSQSLDIIKEGPLSSDLAQMEGLWASVKSHVPEQRHRSIS